MRSILQLHCWNKVLDILWFNLWIHYMIFYLFSITYNLLMVLNFHYLIRYYDINLLQIDIHDIIYLNEFISWFSIHATNIYLQVTFSENTFFTISTSSTKCNQCWKIVILLQCKRMMQNDYTKTEWSFQEKWLPFIELLTT